MTPAMTQRVYTELDPGAPIREQPRWFADIRTEFLHELKWCRQIPAVAVYRRRAAKLIGVDPHQHNLYTLVRKKSTSANLIAACTIIETVLYWE